MLCPHCEIDTKAVQREGETVQVCRNPQCPYFDKVIPRGGQSRP